MRTKNKNLWVHSSEYPHQNDIGSIYVMRAKKPLSWVKPAKVGFYINLGYLQRAKEFRKKVWLESHIFYFYLLEKYEDKEIIKLINYLTNSKYEYSISWYDFTNKKLFTRIDDKSLVDYRINKNLWIFWRRMRHYFIYSFKMQGKKLDIKKLEKQLYTKDLHD